MDLNQSAHSIPTIKLRMYNRICLQPWIVCKLHKTIYLAKHTYLIRAFKTILKTTTSTLNIWMKTVKYILKHILWVISWISTLANYWSFIIWTMPRWQQIWIFSRFGLITLGLSLINTSNPYFSMWKMETILLMNMFG